MSDAFERVIRPIVEGQIRGFIKEHPSILKGVDWYKPRTDKAITFTNSLAKRIIRDLACPTVRARLAAALLEGPTERAPSSAVELVAAAKRPRLELQLGAALLRRLGFWR